MLILRIRCTVVMAKDVSLQGRWFESDHYDVSEYDAFELRVRGDGRRFIVNIGAPGLARKDDLWQCFLYTKGGPDWENIRVIKGLLCLPKLYYTTICYDTVVYMFIVPYVVS